MLHKYPHIDNYYKSINDMLGESVVVTEKLDGSNFSVYIIWDGYEWKIQYRSRNQVITDGKMFTEAIEIANSLHSKFLTLMEANEWHAAIFYFETIGKGIQRRINYDRYIAANPTSINERTIVLLDVQYFTSIEENPGWLVIEKMTEVAEYLGVQYPMWYKIPRFTLENLEPLLEKKDIEGYVIRAENAETVKYTYYGELHRLKVKTNWYNSFEKNGPTNKTAKQKTPPEIVEFFLNTINFGRLHSIYSHGHDTLKYEMADMRYLPDLVIEDIKEEDSSLWDKFDATLIRKTASRMLPKVLTAYLLDRNTK